MQINHLFFIRSEASEEEKMYVLLNTAALPGGKGIIKLLGFSLGLAVAAFED